MPWLEKRPNRKNFYICFYGPDGKRIAKSTGVDDLEAAQSILNETNAIYKKRSHEIRINNLLEKINESFEPRTHILITSIWECFLKQPQPRTLGKNTLEAKERHIRNWKDWMLKNHPEIQYLDEVTEKHAGEYVFSLSSSSGSTINNRLSNLKSVFSIIRIAAELNKNIWDAIPRVENKSISKNSLTLKQIQAIYNASLTYESRWPHFWPTAILLGFHSSLRFGYVCTLSWEEVDFKRKVIKAKKIENSDRKSKKELAPYPIPEELLLRLKHLLSLSKEKKGYIWPKVARVKLSRQGVLYEEFREICKKCKIQTSREPESGEKRKSKVLLVGFHSLRHSYITIARDSGADTGDIQRTVGHGNPKMTNQYNQSIEAASRIAKIMPSVTNRHHSK